MRLVFLFLLLMAVCKGCKKAFNNDHGLKRHRISCKPAKELTASLFQMRQDLQRNSKSRIEPQGVPEIVSINISREYPRLMIYWQISQPTNGDSDMIVDNKIDEPELTSDPIPKFQPPPTSSGRQRRFPRHYQDFLPSSTTNIPHMPPKQSVQPASHPEPQPLNIRSPSPVAQPPQANIIKTDQDDFCLYRVYKSYPRTNPDEMQDLESRCDAPGLAIGSQNHGDRWWTGLGLSKPNLSLEKDNFFAPFLNPTVFRLMNWFYSGSPTKSIAELQSLVDDVILAPDFRVSDLDGFSTKRELQRLDGGMNSNISTSTPFAHENGWKQSSIYIKLPCENVLQEEGTAHTLEVPGVYHRSLVEVITTAFQDAAAKTFHFTPFSLYWQPTPESPPERVYSEIYNSDSFLEEDEKIRGLPPEPGPQYEHAVAALMVSSDSTHLGQFGSAALWPIYLFFGNQSKYDRAKPSQFAMHHTAYIPSVNNPLFCF
jgi:hypothetical protein